VSLMGEINMGKKKHYSRLVRDLLIIASFSNILAAPLMMPPNSARQAIELYQSGSYKEALPFAERPWKSGRRCSGRNIRLLPQVTLTLV